MNERDGTYKQARNGIVLRIALFFSLGVLACAAGVLLGLEIFRPEPAWESLGTNNSIEKQQPNDISVARFIRHREPKAVPDIEFSDAEGKPRHLSEWHGKAIILNLWATWCAPCKTEMPSLDRLQAKLAGQGITVLALSTDRGGIKAPAEFFAKEAITHLALYNDNTFAATSSLKAPGLPLTLLVDEEGREVARVVGPADWDKPETTAQIQALLFERKNSG